MKKIKIITLVAMLILTSTIICRASAQTQDEMQTFFYKVYAGITIRVDATNETKPNENLTVKLWYNCTADFVHVDHLNLTICGFKEGTEEVILNNTCALESTPLSFNYTGEFEVVVQVPDDVWGVACAEFYLKYSIADSPLQCRERFSITAIRNVRYEELQKKYNELSEAFSHLNETFSHLNETYSLLNRKFWESFGKNLTMDELLRLNATYWELLQNYTALEGSINELNNTRVAVGVLAVTTIFFVATTVYLVMRKPKDYW